MRSNQERGPEIGKFPFFPKSFSRPAFSSVCSPRESSGWRAELTLVLLGLVAGYTSATVTGNLSLNLLVVNLMTDFHEGNCNYLDLLEEIAFLHWQDLTVAAIQLPTDIGWQAPHGRLLDLE